MKNVNLIYDQYGGLDIKKTKLKIGMFSWESLYSVKVGGIAPHVSELSETLAKKGHEVHLFTRSGGLQDYELINGVHYHRISHDQSGNIVHQMDKMCDAMYYRYREVIGEYGDLDILHGHDWHPVNVLCRIKAEDGTPFILTYHSTEWGRNGNKHGGWWEATEISHKEWLGGYEAAEVIITSNILKSEVQHLYQIPDYKISIIPNGIYAGKMRKELDPGMVKRKYGISPLAPVILFIGRMSYQKGPDLMVQAIPHVLAHRSDAQFVFIGEGEMRPYCQQIAWDSGIAHVTHFLGYAPDEEAIDWNNACDIVCIPSRNEPFGIVVLEAWDAGKTVVATDAVKLIDCFINGITVYQSPDSIAWGINYVLDGMGLRKLGEEGQHLVETKYNWDSVSCSTINIYIKASSKMSNPAGK